MTRELPLFWNLCRLRTGPEEVPYSPSLALMVALAWAAVSWPLVATLLPLQGGRVPAYVLVGGLAEAALVFFLLNWRGFRSRLLQTLTALFGADLILTALSLPLALPFANAPATTPENVPPVVVVLALLQLFLVAWGLVVKAHILRSALEVPRLVAYLLAVSLFLAAHGVLGLMFPEIQAAAQTR